MDRFISHACPLVFGAHHRVLTENERDAALDLECRGFKSVLMLLSSVVYAPKGTKKVQSFLVPKGKVRGHPFIVPPKSPAIRTIFLNNQN